jgi:hypothetical protein
MKKPLFFVVVAIGVSILLAPGRLSAHHAFAAEFDAQKPVTLNGTIVRMEWFNPHAWLYIDVREPDGKTTQWALEFSSAGSLTRRGWRTDDLPVGAEVTVEGYRAKNGSNTANARTVQLADGRRLFAGSSGTGAPVEPPQ